MLKFRGLKISDWDRLAEFSTNYPKKKKHQQWFYQTKANLVIYGLPMGHKKLASKARNISARMKKLDNLWRNS